MLRVLCLMLLAGASVAHAGEHYREVWNPPEAGHVQRPQHKAGHKPAAGRLSAKRSTKTKPARVNTSVAKPAKREHAGRAVRIHAGARVQNLPPLRAHKGSVLRVDSNGARPEIVQ